MAKNTPSPTSLEELHSFYVYAEGLISESQGDILKTIENLKKDTQKLIRDKNNKKQIPIILNACKIFALTTPSKNPQNIASQHLRLKRKELDSQYMKNLMLSAINSSATEESLNLAKAFMQQIKKEDPAYYDDIIAITLKQFKELPKTFGYKITQDKKFIMAPQDIEKIQNAQKFINKLFPEYQIQSTQKEHKHYALCVMDRILFNGAISHIKYSQKNSTIPSASSCIKELKQTKEYKDDNNAQVIITLLDSFLKKNPKLDNKPFPQLINEMVSSFYNNTKQHKIAFQTIKTDMWGDFEYRTNDKFANFYANITQNFLSKLNPGTKYKYREKIEKNDETIALICNGIEKYLLTNCEKYKFNKNVIYAAFASHKLDEKNKIHPNYHRKIYHWLTNQLKINIPNDYNNETHREDMFTASLHHDKARIYSDLSPNKDETNFILTLIPPAKLNFVDIYERFVKYLSTEALNDETINKSILASEQQKIDKARANPQEQPQTYDVHTDIFHGADLNIIAKDSDKSKYLQFILTPNTDTLTAQNYVVAVTNSAEPIYAKNNPSLDTIFDKEKQKIQLYVNAQKALRI